MLKPKKKITRKEIKRDPFLETIDKFENSFEKRQKINVPEEILLILNRWENS